ncbi:PREDICTED: calmodulin-binding transcription activator 3 [Tarenaya hassleriana]|uniref:calmodulin-binding transcription activator 3 n=1 Tax=Tarenaya hassleriana TaxID=28532 RepID=UPI00053CA9B3|nr:PREDICTED: calmodulin-binding transcription activator 3 [Tarenaya hassleriana]
MAEARRSSAINRLDMDQILLEAQNRWLRPPEICEILRNYQRFQISTEAPTRPPSGSLFLFNRKELRFFRKDGHNWRKKKDGKTVKEAHERLKAGSIDVLHCYYAHGEDNENLQRRSYWMLEEELSHIVFVHYLEVKGSRVSTSFNGVQRTEDASRCSPETGDALSNEFDGCASCSINQNYHSMYSQTTDTASVSGVQTSDYEDAESAYNHHANSKILSQQDLQPPGTEEALAGFDPYYQTSLPVRDNYQKGFLAMPGPNSSIMVDKNKENNCVGLTSGSRKSIDSQTWEEILGNCGSGFEVLPFQAPYTSVEPTNARDGISKQEHDILDQLLHNFTFATQDFASQQDPMEKCQARILNSDFTSVHTSRFHGQDLEAMHNPAANGNAPYSSVITKHLFDGPLDDKGLKKMDSFNRWMSRELGDVDDLASANDSFTHSRSRTYWDEIETENGANTPNSRRDLDGYAISPSLSQEQLFSIIDFSPSWTYAGHEVKVLVTGRFLKAQEDFQNFKWSCMFGQFEVPAEVIADGVLRCIAPMHEVARVPFYITCSNRLACSEVREFEFRVGHAPAMDRGRDDSTHISIENLQARFVKLLCSKSVCPTSVASTDSDLSHVNKKISSLLVENTNDLDQMLTVSDSGNVLSSEKMKNQLIEKLLKEKLHSWLLVKVAERGKGPSVLDESGQGVLHFAAALGYDWALEPTVIAGVSVNFRDVNGWTALHWAAFFGREHTVGSLIALGADPGAVTDPTPVYPSGCSTSDLAYANGHKGIAGYLAESALEAHLSLLSLTDQLGDGGKASPARTAADSAPGKSSSSMTDSLAAVSKATQAAARIHQVFRVQSFQRKQMKEFGGNNKFGMSNEHALSLVTLKANKAGRYTDDSVYAAATRIQNKFRSYKGRKDYLITRQRIIKIQAHVRGYQVRKNYRKIIWSVGILEKVILRWRRKGSGLRGFKPEALTDRMQDISENEDDDDDFFKKGRKQTEERLHKALARVKSMAQYPEARDQYRRLLNVVNEIQESKIKALAISEETSYIDDDDLIDLDALLDDTPMSF